MYFDEKFVASLPIDPRRALLEITDRFHGAMSTIPEKDTQTQYILVKEVMAFLSAYFEREGLTDVCDDGQGSIYHLPAISGQFSSDFQSIGRYLTVLRRDMTERIHRGDFEQTQQVFRLMLGTAGFHYEFSEGDLARIQKLVNELRGLIAGSGELEEGHKRRVLGRLEKLQSELHKRVSDLSWFWGELIEASIAARIIGENAKPIVDRIREIVGIVWPVQSRAFELPSDTPFKLPGEIEDKKSK
jgi:hypothetical protein